ncbi:prenyltransferase/squalene oxidase repeat-containing protein [Nocardioides xinjiangensis]|uniref:prenyltransferase/squalene oxidase repeat-containing protein n=1 Tax=Nocardioides xinjiangensis TaxID=2817376 RepID=UPI001B30510A|nr:MULTISPECIES: prenyltransferase/squalene oxidase repeat-containing protein [unclassified Nocardioides]
MKLLSGLAAIAVAATTLVAAPAGAAPMTPTRLAGDWIASQLTDGIAVGDFADIGLSIDAGLAFEAIGDTAGAELVADRIEPALVTSEAYPYGYVTSDEYSWPGNEYLGQGRYANATAKAAAFAGRVGRDAATAYDNVDLVAQLEDLTDDATGVIGDDTSFSDYANTIGQAFAVEALARAGSDEAGAATQALLAQQCPAGYFLFTLGSTECGDVPSADVTALAVISLRASGIGSTRVAAAVALATQWLESVQKSDGSFEGDASTPGSNANSTGLAGWALGEVGRSTSAARAAVWTRSMQVADAGACASQAPTGAVAYNVADLSAARTDGIAGSSTVRDKWRRATFQSAPVLRWAPAATEPLSISTPVSAAERTTVAATVRGLAAGEQACVSLGGDARRVVGTGSDLVVSFVLPAGAAARTFTLATLGGTTTSTTAAIVTPAPATPAAPATGELSVPKVVRVKNNDVVKVEIACDAARPCAGRLKLRSARKVELAGGERRTLVLAKSSYTVAPGATATVKTRLTKPARAVLGKKRLRVVATQTARGAEPARTTFWIRRR